MDDLISRKALMDAINRDPRGQAIAAMRSGKVLQALTIVLEHIRTAPAVDAVEVVRCKDCKHRGVADQCPMCGVETVYYNEGEYSDGSECWDVYDEVTDRTVDDGFCNFGERRTDDAD